MSTRVRLDVTMAQANALLAFAEEGASDNAARYGNAQYDMPVMSHEAGLRAIEVLGDAIVRADERRAAKRRARETG